MLDYLSRFISCQRWVPGCFLFFLGDHHNHFSELAHSAVSPQARDMLEEEGGGEERRGKEQQHIFGEIVKVVVVVVAAVVVVAVVVVQICLINPSEGDSILCGPVPRLNSPQDHLQFRSSGIPC